jgi:hypothetical protein
LSGIQVLLLNSAGINDPEGPELFRAAIQHLTHAVGIIKKPENSDPTE